MTVPEPIMDPEAHLMNAMLGCGVCGTHDPDSYDICHLHLINGYTDHSEVLKILHFCEVCIELILAADWRELADRKQRYNP